MSTSAIGLSRTTIDNLRQAHRALLPVRESLACVRTWTQSEELRDPNVPKLSEIIGSCQALEAACEVLVLATDQVWKSAIHDFHAGIDATIRPTALRANEAALIEDSKVAMHRAVDAIEDMQRAFGLDLLDSVKNRGLLTPAQALELGRLLRAFGTDMVPWYGTVTTLLRALGFGDFELMLDQVAAPSRAPLALAALERGMAQFEVAKSYFQFTRDAILGLAKPDASA